MLALLQLLKTLLCRALRAFRAPFRKSASHQEKLGIRTDTPSRWQSQDLRITKDLRPRQGEPAKSAWAHGWPDSAPFEVVLSGRTATGLLQAVALLLFAHRNKSSIRLELHLVSVHRSALPKGTVIDDAGMHPVPRFDCSHRSIRTEDEEQRRRLVQRISGPEVVHSYTREQLIPLLEHLVANRRLRAQFEPVARRIIDESAARR